MSFFLLSLRNLVFSRILKIDKSTESKNLHGLKAPIFRPYKNLRHKKGKKRVLPFTNVTLMVLFWTGKNTFIHQINATLEIFNPFQELVDHVFTYKCSTMLWHNHFYIHTAHHVHP